MVALDTGLRHAEILALRRGNVDLGKRVIWVPQTKAGAREQPITRELAEYFIERRKMLPPAANGCFRLPEAPPAMSIRSARRSADLTNAGAWIPT